MNVTDESIYLDRVLNGDTASYRWFVNKYKQVSYRLAYTMLRNREDAEDVTQEAFVRAYIRLHKFNRESGFGTWLYRIVYNGCIDRIRKRKNDQVSEDHGAGEKDPGNWEDSSMTRGDRERYLALALQELSVEERTLVTLFYVDEKDMNEIGASMGASHAAVRKRMTRIRARLREQLTVLLGEEVKELL